jgi:hypothetical protein
MTVAELIRHYDEVSPPARQRFSSRRHQLVMAACGAVIALSGLVGAVAGGEIVVAVICLLLGVFIVVRALGSSSITLDANEVTTSSTFRTRRFPLSRLAAVEVVEGQAVMSSSRLEFLVLHFVDGGRFAFKDFTSRVVPGQMTVVRSAADGIRAAIARGRR